MENKTIYMELESKWCCLLEKEVDLPSIEQPQSHEFPVTSMEWKFEICSAISMQVEGFGETMGILMMNGPGCPDTGRCENMSL